MLPRRAAKIAIGESTLPNEAENVAPEDDRLQLRTDKAVKYSRMAIEPRDRGSDRAEMHPVVNSRIAPATQATGPAFPCRRGGVVIQAGQAKRVRGFNSKIPWGWLGSGGVGWARRNATS